MKYGQEHLDEVESLLEIARDIEDTLDSLEYDTPNVPVWLHEQDGDPHKHISEAFYHIAAANEQINLLKGLMEQWYDDIEVEVDDDE